MRNLSSIAVGAALLVSTAPLSAAAQTIVSQTAPPATAPAQPAYVEPEPDRIEAARELLEILMPSEQREAMLAAMIEPLMANIQAGLLQSPTLETAFANTPGAETLFLEFMATQRAREMELATTSLPGMMEAMARAYARRFTRREMRNIGDFFESDAGQAYLLQSNTIMADPDIAAWQRQTMAQSMQQMQADIPELMARISALQNGEAPAPATNQSVTNSNLEAMRGGGNQTPPAEPDTEE